MSQPKYLIKRRDWIEQQSDFSAFYKDYMQQTGSIGGIRVMSPTGKVNKSKIQIMPEKGGQIFTIPATAKAIKHLIRKLRPEEEAQLNQIDQQILELRNLRKTILKTAWQRGHVVTLKEIKEKIK